MPCSELEGHHCAFCGRNRIVVARENKCEYRLVNESGEKICRVKIDGCYIIEGKKCDYLIVQCERKIAYFVELKGRSFLNAVEQITQSIDRLADLVKKLDSVNARIILTKVSIPNIKNNPKVLRLEKKLKKLNGDLRKETIQFIENV